MNPLGRLTITATCWALGIIAPANAYEIRTHEDLTQAAVVRSILDSGEGESVLSNVLSHLGLKHYGDQTQTFPNSLGERTILQLFRDGAKFEDSLFPTVRPFRHFYNPVSGQGLLAFMSSPSWALAAPGSDPDQEFSYWNARQSFYAALTAETELERNRAFGRTFQTLGHVLHHLQDMAQPQHVRNDPHIDCDSPLCSVIGSGRSRYEKFTDGVRGNLPMDAPAGYYSSGFWNPEGIWTSNFASIFNNPRRFWNTETGQNSPAAGMGIAEFTNRNFVSYGTNFDKPSLFSQPVQEILEPDVDIQVACQGADWCSGLQGRMTFYGNIVRDNFLGSGADTENRRASTLSLFDQDLISRGQPKRYSLNRFNFQAAHDFLIPRAVAYSVGMINYFFRGRIDLVSDYANPGTFLIKNQGYESMTGTFSLHYDDATNNRTRLIEWSNVSVPSNGQTNIGAIPYPTSPLPPPKNPGEYMLVFKGGIGAETGAGFEAVAGRIVLIRWTITDLGVPPGGYQSEAYAISSNGLVAGNWQTLSGEPRAFLWSSTSGIQDLGTIPGTPPGGSSFTHARGVNDNGHVVGNSLAGPFLWSQGSGMQSLNLLLGVQDLGAAAGINNAGQIVGTASSRGFVVSGGLLYLGVEGTYSPAYAINNFGQVVGQTFTPSGFHAFLGFGLQDLLTLPGDIHSVAYGINDNGQVVGASYGGSLPQRAFLWSSGSMQDLGTLPNGTLHSATAYGINNTGQVVGENGGWAFLWSTTTGMQDLSLGPEVFAAGWSSLRSARAINNAGQIVGTGINRLGQIRAFLLTPIR